MTVFDCNVCQDCETCAKLLAEHNNSIVNDILYMLNNPVLTDYEPTVSDYLSEADNGHPND